MFEISDNDFYSSFVFDIDEDEFYKWLWVERIFRFLLVFFIFGVFLIVFFIIFVCVVEDVLVGINKLIGLVIILLIVFLCIFKVVLLCFY